MNNQSLVSAVPWCAIDFGTSNSAIALGGGSRPQALLALEEGQLTMPTAVFYQVEDLAPGELPVRLYGREALRAYVAGHEGRLMRSMKSILGSSLAEQSTDIGEGRAVRYMDVIGDYLRRLKAVAERELGGGQDVGKAVLGRPVFFVDDDPARDAAAQRSLEAAARAVGFAEVSFQYEPIAAALDYEQSLSNEQLVLVADIGGGTSDFSVVRVGPDRRHRLDRKPDILANHGVHVAGTDFDRRIELASILPLCGYGGLGPQRAGEAPREIPSRVYFDLSTWHLVNTVYSPQRLSELRRMRAFYGDPRQYERLMKVVERRLGHALLAEAEAAKISVAAAGQAAIDLSCLEAGIEASVHEAQAAQALDADLDRIAAAAEDTVRAAAVGFDRINAVYFTGGSTGFKPLVDKISTRLPCAKQVFGDRLASVAQGLAVHAQRLHA